MLYQFIFSFFIVPCAHDTDDFNVPISQKHLHLMQSSKKEDDAMSHVDYDKIRTPSPSHVTPQLQASPVIDDAIKNAAVACPKSVKRALFKDPKAVIRSNTTRNSSKK